MWTAKKHLKCCPGKTPGQQIETVLLELQNGASGPRWVFTTVLPSIRKYGQYKLFDSPWNKMIMISNETDLHYKVVDLIRKYYPDSILVAGLGENQDSEDKRLD